MGDIYLKTTRQIPYIYASDDGVVRSVKSGVSILVINYGEHILF